MNTLLNRTKHRALPGALAIIACLSVASCATSSEGAAPAQSSANATADQKLVQALPQSFKDSGKVNVAVSIGGVPEAFLDDKGELVGWEIDIMKAAAAKLGLTPEFSNVSFDTIIPGLQADRYDIAFGQIGITNARMKLIDQVSTGLSNQAFVALADSKLEINTLDDLCGVSIGIGRGTRQQDFAEAQTAKCTASGKEPIDIHLFDGSTKSNLAMTSGRVDVSWSGSTGQHYYVKMSDGKAKVVGHYLEPYPLGGALPKGSEFAPSFSDAVDSLIADGTYKEIMTKWGLDENLIENSDVNPTVKDQ
jgi:polar amino acid transport system substrate-binding protein